ncbi:MAG: hypothetical protein KF784_04185 [Fimbriimonadaceae bacterium]|nr:hypothetical protein [Fimbriimonadaceae bacterium]
MSDEHKPEESGQQAPPVQSHGGTDWSRPPEQAPIHGQGQYQRGPNDGMQTLIPTKNANALAAYYCAVFALVPCFTIFLAPTAIVLGVKGLKNIKENPGLPGAAHAWVGIIGGTGLLLLILIGFAIWAVIQAAG